MSSFASRQIRATPLAVEQAQTFVDAMRSIHQFGDLADGWAGPGTLRPRAPALKAAKRLMEDRQALATRLTPKALPDGGIAIGYREGVDASGDEGHVHIDKAGRPAIIQGAPAPNAPQDPRFKGVTDRKFRKALTALIAPTTGRIKVKKTEIDGITFDSEIEGRRYLILRGEEANGRISNLRLQVPYEFVENGRLCFTYVADFVYEECGAEVVEDVKGMRLDVYILKKKLIEARYGIVVTEWPVSRKELARRAAAQERSFRLDAEAAAKAARADERERRRIERDREAQERAARRAAKGDARNREELEAVA